MFSGTRFALPRPNGYREQDIKEVFEEVEARGGTVQEEIDEKAHAVLIAHKEHPKYAEAVQKFGCKSVVHPCWLEECIQMDRLLDPCSKKSYLPLPSKNGLPGMAGKKISLTGYNGLNREELKILVEQAGASYTGSFSRENDLLICYEHTGMKFERAKEWSREPAQYGRPFVVNHLWLLDCFKEQKWLEPEPYCRLSGEDIGLSSLECTPLDLKGKDLGSYFEELRPLQTEEEDDIVRSSVPETANEVPDSAHRDEEAYSDAPTEVDFHDAVAPAAEEEMSDIERKGCAKARQAKPSAEETKTRGEEIRLPCTEGNKRRADPAMRPSGVGDCGKGSKPVLSPEGGAPAEAGADILDDDPTPEADEEIERLFAQAKQRRGIASKAGSRRTALNTRRPLGPTNPPQSPELSRPEKSRRVEKDRETKSSSPCVALSGMHTDEKNKFTKHVKDLGCKLSSDKHEWKPETTHLVLPRLIRGEKVVAAAAAGIWVLRTSFIEASLAQRSLVSEVEHEWSGGGGSKLASNIFSFWRLYRSSHGHGPFFGITFALPSRLTGPLTRGMLERVIKAGDGTVVLQKSPLHSVDVAVLDTSVRRSDPYASRCASAGLFCVHGNFVVEWVAHPGTPSHRFALFSTHPGPRLLALEQSIQNALA